MVVGGGHNGLVAACYLAQRGVEVTVLEQAEHAGGGSRTEETVPGFRFDTHSAAHNIINMTAIPAELALAEVGLRYLEMEPFAAGFFPDGRVVRFHRSVERTLASIAEHDAEEARRYARFMELALPLIDVAVTGIGGGPPPGGLLAALRGKALPAMRAVRKAGGPLGLAHDLAMPYGALLEARLGSDLTRAPVSAFAAHSSAGPVSPGSAMFAFWQAAYHRFGQWHAVGGAQGLTDALLSRLASLGGRVRTGALVTRLETAGGAVRAVHLAGGERLVADTVITAIDPKTALLELLDPPLGGQTGRDLAATHRSNTVQFVVHLASDELPAYPGARPGDYAGLQSHVDTLDELRAAFVTAEAGRLPDQPPTYAFTPSALDATLAPEGQHTIYLACPAAPAEVVGGWEHQQEAFADAMVLQLERHAPGITSHISGRAVRSPATMAQELRWPGAHPMVLDISLDQLSFLRPTRELASHRTPVTGLYLSGAGTAPMGGVAGSPGKAAALAVLADREGPSRRRWRPARRG